VAAEDRQGAQEPEQRRIGNAEDDSPLPQGRPHPVEEFEVAVDEESQPFLREAADRADPVLGQQEGQEGVEVDRCDGAVDEEVDPMVGIGLD
jgi:hypothetical protein